MDRLGRIGKRVIYEGYGKGLIVGDTGDGCGNGYLEIIFENDKNTLCKLPCYQIHSLTERKKLIWLED